MATPDLLSRALQNAMAYNAKDTQYEDVYGQYLQGKDRGRKDKQLQRAADMQDELEGILGGMPEPTEDEILGASLKVSTKYGDADSARDILKVKQAKLDAQQEAAQKKSERLRKELNDVVQAYKINPRIGQMVLDNTSIKDKFSNDYGLEVYNQKRNSKSGQKSTSMVNLFDDENNVVTVPKDKAVETIAEGRFIYKTPRRKSGGDSFSNQYPSKKPGADADARDDARLQTPSRPAREGMKWQRNKLTGELQEVPR